MRPPLEAIVDLVYIGRYDSGLVALAWTGVRADRGHDERAAGWVHGVLASQSASPRRSS